MGELGDILTNVAAPIAVVILFLWYLLKKGEADRKQLDDLSGRVEEQHKNHQERVKEMTTDFQKTVEKISEDSRYVHTTQIDLVREVVEVVEGNKAAINSLTEEIKRKNG